MRVIRGLAMVTVVAYDNRVIAKGMLILFLSEERENYSHE